MSQDLATRLLHLHSSSHDFKVNILATEGDEAMQDIIDENWLPVAMSSYLFYF